MNFPFDHSLQGLILKLIIIPNLLLAPKISRPAIYYFISLFNSQFVIIRGIINGRFWASQK